MSSDRVKRLVAKRPRATTVPTDGRHGTFWVTRDTDAAGNLSDHMQVWIERPKSFFLSGGARRWLAPTRDYQGLYESYWVANPPSWIRTIPTGPLECVRHEGDGPAVKVQS